MRIAIDIDDTITETYQNNLDILRKYNYDVKDTKDFSESELETFINTHINEILETMRPKENVSNVLKRLKEENCKIYILSARNVNGYVPYKETIKFFNEFDIPYDELYLDLKSKGDIAKKLKIDLIIDDSIKHLNNCNEYGINCIQFGNTSSNYKKFDNWLDIEKYIKEEYNG